MTGPARSNGSWQPIRPPPLLTSHLAARKPRSKKPSIVSSALVMYVQWTSLPARVLDREWRSSGESAAFACTARGLTAALKRALIERASVTNPFIARNERFHCPRTAMPSDSAVCSRFFLTIRRPCRIMKDAFKKKGIQPSSVPSGTRLRENPDAARLCVQQRLELNHLLSPVALSDFPGSTAEELYGAVSKRS